MRIRDIFETSVAEKIEPVIKVGERQDSRKLAAEIGSYVVTPTIEKYLDDFLEHYTETFRQNTTEVGVWISGYFGSGKSHLAKIAAMLAENPTLEGVPAAKRFEARVPAGAPHRESICRSLSRLAQCESRVLAFNLNTLSESKKTPLPLILLSQWYLSKGYGANVLYARVIEAELDKRGKLADLHAAAERLAGKPWAEIQKNPTFYSNALYKAACEVADVFESPQDVNQALNSAKEGELHNVQMFVRTVLDDVDAREKATSKPCRVALVLDESGQWIEDDAGRLAQLQALVEEAAIQGQGKLWIFVTTHEDMGSIYQNAKALKGDMKKIEGRFRYKWNLTTENIELVLEDRVFKKTVAGRKEVTATYNQNPGVLRDLGQLANVSQKLPECTEERFATFYPFFPFQIHLVPEIVKSLRSSGGRGEQLSGSTRTLLAITQDILRAGRRDYLDSAVGEVVSFDEVYGNLAGEGEVSADARRELSRVESVVPEASDLTRRVAEVLYLIREIAYIPRTIGNIARLLVEHTDDDLATLEGKVRPELDRLISAKVVAQLGEEYEFLTGERRTFEEEVANEMAAQKWQDLQAGLAKFASADVLGFETVPHKGAEFAVKIGLDGTSVTRDGHVEVRVHSPLASLGGLQIRELEDMSLRPDEQKTLFVWSPPISGFDRQLKYYLAMGAVVSRWKGDPTRSTEAHQLAQDRESKDLTKLKSQLVASIREGIRGSHVIFKGSGRVVTPKPGSSPGEALRLELASYWPTLYPKYDKVPVRIANEQKAISDVLQGAKQLSADVAALKLFDNAGQLDPHCPLLDEIRIFLSAREAKSERTLGTNLSAHFESPPYGWDPGAIRVGVAALVRAGALKVLIEKKPFTNPADAELQEALRASRKFDKVELALESIEVKPDVLVGVRKLLIQLTKKRKIDETPAALSAEMSLFGEEILSRVARVELWSKPASFSLPTVFLDGKDAFEKILALSDPNHRVNEIDTHSEKLPGYAQAIEALAQFVEKWGDVFTQMRDFANQLSAVEHRLAPAAPGKLFLANWRAANQAASVAEPDVWKDLQDGLAAANVQITQLLSEWREEARRIAQSALDSMTAEIKAHGLPMDEVQEALGAPLRDFVGGISSVNGFAAVAAQPDRARALVTELGDAIRAEVEKRKPKPPPGQPVPAKPVKRIRVSEVAAAVRIETEGQWTILKDRLDQDVRRALRDGNDVEIG